MITAQRALLAAGAAVLLGLLLSHQPALLPWTPLAPAQPAGLFTGYKLQRLAGAPAQCEALLAASRIPRQPGCPGDPPDPGAACAFDLALHLWQRDIVAPAALARFGQPLAGLELSGSCPVPGPGEARAGGHAITGFRLADGRVISVATGWDGPPDEAAFLRQVRDGACRLFATTRSPDFGPRGAGVLYLDEAAHPQRYCD